MKVYKLTDENGKTRNNTQWGPGVTHTADGKSAKLCNKHWVHAYADPVLAVLMNPAHGQFANPQLWECEAEVKLQNADKLGCVSLTTLRVIPLPPVTTAQCREFARLAALAVYPLWRKYDENNTWHEWAKNPGANMAANVAYAAYIAAAEAAYIANEADIAAAKAAYAAYNAHADDIAAAAPAYAANAGAHAAKAGADTSRAGNNTTAHAANAGAYASDAINAAYGAASTEQREKLDLVKIARQAVTDLNR